MRVGIINDNDYKQFVASIINSFVETQEFLVRRFVARL